ncbi:hypothetical protein SUDANB171_00577 [Streptomyces sp. enrichment culture]|uniref:hypothetical protein n=1 Tax=Streptomyces sp. enrichment culture TaxID=1795815 RepID=UPI003F566198
MEGRRLHGRLGVLVAPALSVLAGLLLGRSWSACGAGTNNAANSLFLFWLFGPGLCAVLLLTWVAVGAVLGHRPFLHACVLVVTLLGVVWCALSVFWEGTATPACADGVPPWWPSLVPAPGR